MEHSIFRLSQSHKNQDPQSSCFFYRYNKQEFQTLSAVPTASELLPFDQLWIHCGGSLNPQTFKEITSPFEFHKLILEDALIIPQPPKMDDYGDSCFLTLNFLGWNDTHRLLEEHQISFLWKKNLLISLSEAAHNEFQFVLSRLQDSTSNVRALGIDYLVFSLLNFLIDQFFSTAKKMLDYYDELEDNIFFSDFDNIATLHSYRKQITLLSRSLLPLQNILNRLSHPEFRLSSAKTRPLFSNLNNNVTQVINLAEKLRDSFAFLIDSIDSKNTQSANKVMKVLTIVSTIFMPLSFLAGIYGMNFSNMPELSWKFGYPALWGMMIFITGGMIFYFKRKKWW